jgi:hypothetical protein
MYWGDYLAIGIILFVGGFVLGYTYGAWNQIRDLPTDTQKTKKESFNSGLTPN